MAELADASANEFTCLVKKFMKEKAQVLYTVYVLRSLRSGDLYKGTTKNLQKRLGDHQKGKVASTKYYRSFELVFTKIFKERRNAYRYEHFLKSGKGRKYLKNILIKKPMGEWRNWQTRTA